MKRKIIGIDEQKCTGCGLCLPGCPEGALQIIGGKARLVSDLFCDGLGACLGHCPEGAIAIEEREAGHYDERQVIAGIARQGSAVIEAHLKHLRDHHETVYLQQALDYLSEHGVAVKTAAANKQLPASPRPGGGCPGSQTVSFVPRTERVEPHGGDPVESELAHWPIQLHLISPHAPHYQDSELLLAADCTAFAIGGFHQDFLKGRTLAIACPKLDQGQDIYLDKLTSLIEEANVKTLTVLIMQVPCCSGLLRLAGEAMQRAGRMIPLHFKVVGLRGEILQEGSLS